MRSKAEIIAYGRLEGVISRTQSSLFCHQLPVITAKKVCYGIACPCKLHLVVHKFRKEQCCATRRIIDPFCNPHSRVVSCNKSPSNALGSIENIPLDARTTTNPTHDITIFCSTNTVRYRKNTAMNLIAVIISFSWTTCRTTPRPNTQMSCTQFIYRFSIIGRQGIGTGHAIIRVTQSNI